MMWKHETVCRSSFLKLVNMIILRKEKKKKDGGYGRAVFNACSRLYVLFRNGEQIDFLVLNEHYNFEFQQVTNLGKTKTVKPVSCLSLHA